METFSISIINEVWLVVSWVSVRSAKCAIRANQRVFVGARGETLRRLFLGVKHGRNLILMAWGAEAV